MASIHSAYKDDVHDVPMSVIIRPFMPELDEKKVESLMQTIQVNTYIKEIHITHFVELIGFFTTVGVVAKWRDHYLVSE